MTEACVAQACAQAGDEFAARELPLGIADVLAQIVGESTVVAVADPGIGTGLAVATSGEEHGHRLAFCRGGGSAHQTRGVKVIIRTGKDVYGREEEAGAQVLFLRELCQRGKFTCAGAGMAGIQQNFEIDSLGEFAEDGIQFVVGDETSVATIPIHVVRAEDFVHVILDFVTIEVANLAAVPGVVEKQAVARLGTFDEPHQPVEDAPARGTLVGENADVACGEAEVFDQAITQIGDIVDAALQIRPGKLVAVDAD